MRFLTILCLMLVAAKFGTSLAHVAELPGKLRLDEATYKAVQAIYYPGFTIVGLVGEFGGIIALAVLLYLTPFGANRFWWTVAALAFLVAGHATYWLMTHPVNNFLGQGCCHVGSRFYLLLHALRGEAGRLDRAAQSLGTLPRHHRRICHAQPH